MERHVFQSHRDKRTESLDGKLGERLKKELSSPELSNEELFSFAPFNADAAEQGGYSDYSYWRSTLRAFFKNKVAVFFLLVLAVTLAFTFIQPYLPNQRDPI